MKIYSLRQQIVQLSCSINGRFRYESIIGISHTIYRQVIELHMLINDTSIIY